jgi:putative tryptophan/tyrosine transport system substrate-binding protein
LAFTFGAFNARLVETVIRLAFSGAAFQNACQVARSGAPMRRREFVAGAAAVFALPHLAWAQSNPNIPRIGILWPDGTPERTPNSRPRFGDILVEALGSLGYVDGKTARFIHRFPAAQADVRGCAQELVDDNVDLIVAISVLGASEAQRLTSSIPIVVVFASDLVRIGLVDSLAHPGRNVTGLTLISDELHAKRLSLLKEAVPTLARVILLYSKTPFSQIAVDAQLNAAKSLGLALRPVVTQTPDAIDPAFAGVASDGTEGVTLSPQPMLTIQSARVAAAALAHRIPTMGYYPGMARDGLLMAYGQDYDEYVRKAAGYVDKILRGAKPADLPVEQPTLLKLAINLKTATVLGLNISQSLQARADEVIE